MAEPWAEIADGLQLSVRVTPKASRSALVGTTPLPDGRSARNIGKVKRMGVVVAKMTGTIRKV